MLLFLELCSNEMLRYRVELQFVKFVSMFCHFLVPAENISVEYVFWRQLKWCTDDRALEEEAEKKFGWILKIFFLGTAGLVGYQFFPYMGINSFTTGIELSA